LTRVSRTINLSALALILICGVVALSREEWFGYSRGALNLLALGALVQFVLILNAIHRDLTSTLADKVTFSAWAASVYPLILSIEFAVPIWWAVFIAPVGFLLGYVFILLMTALMRTVTRRVDR